MWIERAEKKEAFVKAFLGLDKQVLLMRGARQVGKTSFILNALQGLSDYPQLKLNLLYPSSFTLDGVHYLGRDFFGNAPTGEYFLKNIEMQFGKTDLQKPPLVFIDEVDRHPLVMESIQTLAEFSYKYKFVLTGSNLENIAVKNAATGRKKYFDLYPITFTEFLLAGGLTKLHDYLHDLTFRETTHSDFFHRQLCELVGTYLRIGGMPRIVDAYLDPGHASQPIPEIVKDLAVTIEENVKTVLGEKTKLYEYENVLRKLTHLSMSTLKYTNLQVQHAGRSEAKKLVAKTVGAMVAHRIRLFESERDLSKVILFDCGIVQYLLCGADLLRNAIGERNLAVLYETFVGTELIAKMVTRDDLFYWKSGNRAEVEYLLRSPRCVGIDVKSGRGDTKSLNSLAIFEPDVSCLVKISNESPRLERDYVALLPNYDKRRTIPLIVIPHYLTCRLFELLSEVKSLQ
jgi:predicted AAA+ superfamily ATPase